VPEIHIHRVTRFAHILPLPHIIYRVLIRRQAPGAGLNGKANEAKPRYYHDWIPVLWDWSFNQR
jgi:hypothetical protein